MPDSFLQKAPFPQYPFLTIIRLAYLTVCTLIGLSIGFTSVTTEWVSIAGGGISGFFIGCFALWIEKQLSACSRSIIFGGSLGFMIGMIGLCLITVAWNLGLLEIPFFNPWGIVSCLLLFPYLGVTIGLYFARTGWNLPPPSSSEDDTTHQDTNTQTYSIPKLLDSSAIIDGRVFHLCTTGFLEGPLLIPEFILREIHLIADSDDPSKRTKGKRGLGILAELQRLSHPEIKIVDDHSSQDLTVDLQLIVIAKDRNAKIVTNDWNLAKTANVQGVQSLNVNELTYHLRPLVLPGEFIRVFVQKEGQGFGQGIAHLDDGTMVVIDDGAAAIGRTVDVEVTRFMQTNTGRMVFASPKNHDHSIPSNRSSHLQDGSLGMTLEAAGKNHQ